MLLIEKAKFTVTTPRPSIIGLVEGLCPSKSQINLGARFWPAR